MFGPGIKPQHPQPATPLQWYATWARTREMLIPSKKRKLIRIDLESIEVPLNDAEGKPDLLIKTRHGKEFYLIFDRGAVYQALDKPTLIFPTEQGPDHAFWILKKNASAKIQK